MSKRDKVRRQQYRALEDAGFEIRDTRSYIGYNGGSERLDHVVAKAVAATVCADAGYTIASEVKCGNSGNVDILAYGLEDRQPIVIEVENDLKEYVKRDKISRYVKGPIRECYVLDLDDLPNNPTELYEAIKTEVGL